MLILCSKALDQSLRYGRCLELLTVCLHVARAPYPELWLGQADLGEFDVAFEEPSAIAG